MFTKHLLYQLSQRAVKLFVLDHVALAVMLGHVLSYGWKRLDAWGCLRPFIAIPASGLSLGFKGETLGGLLLGSEWH